MYPSFIVDGVQCRPIKEKSVAIDAGKNGVITTTVTEECQCVSNCFRKSYYEKSTRITDVTQEVVMHSLGISDYVIYIVPFLQEIDIGVCEGHCSLAGQCRPSLTSQYGGPGKLEKNGKPYNPRIIQSCKCIL